MKLIDAKASIALLLHTLVFTSIKIYEILILLPLDFKNACSYNVGKR